MAMERAGQIGREIVVEGVRLRLRPGLKIVGVPKRPGEIELGPGVRIEKDGTVVQNGHRWRSWAYPSTHSSFESTTEDPAVRGLIRDITPLYGIPLFSAPSKRFG